MKHTPALPVFACLAAAVACVRPVAPPRPIALTEQTQEAAMTKSAGCLSCHGYKDNPTGPGIVDDADMHVATMKVKLGCTDCHGGNPDVFRPPFLSNARPLGRVYREVMRRAHVAPRFPEAWESAANPKRSYTLLNQEDPAFIRFVNPTDLRVVDESCGACHPKQVAQVRKSMMTTSALLWGAVTYNNGNRPNKVYQLGESYARDGTPQRLQGVTEFDGERKIVRPPTEAELARGVLPYLDPLPRWNVAQPGNILRSFERGGRIPRINPSEVGSPNPFEEPGKPDMKLGDRGYGTQLRFDPVLLNLQKTRLNDPHLSFLGTNDHAGDYRSSGCAACHVVYANDRDPRHAGPYAVFGHRGLSHSEDDALAKDEPGHPIVHRFTNGIPSSQCMTCHHHQPNAFVNSYFGYTVWDYEMDGEPFWPHAQKRPTMEEQARALESNPEGAVVRGNWGDPEFLDRVSELNAGARRTQFADYHGHGWIFRAVYKKDRAGRWLDKDGKVIPVGDFKNAVHLMDAHAQAGMHCVDCHTSQDNHGDGRLYGEYANAIEIACIDCHGTIRARFGGEEGQQALTSGPAGGRTNLIGLQTPWGEPRFEWRGPEMAPIQRSMLQQDKQWEVPQVRDVINPEAGTSDAGKPWYNEKARLAKTIRRDGITWGDVPQQDAELPHGNDNMECHACHTSWVTGCFGCHLPMRANERRPMKHNEGDVSRNWTSYNPQVVRDDVFMLGRHGGAKGGKVAPVRSSSAVVISSQNANREWIYTQQPPFSAPGYSSQAFNPHFAHTVRGKGETKMCTDCHVSKAGDNNAWMAQLLLQGTDYVNFIGRHAYVAEADDGFEAVVVSELNEPQAVLGSNLHRLAYPDDFRAHWENHGVLAQAVHHGGTQVHDLQLRGEYLYAACGPAGLEVFDVANVANKGFSEKIVTSPVSPLGQSTKVRTTHASSVALPTNMLIHDRNDLLPTSFWEQNQEKKMHPLYRYAYVTDLVEGLILVDVMVLADGEPRNNFLERALTWNPEGILAGARHVELAGSLGFISCDRGLVIVSFDRPLEPKVLSVVPLQGARASAVQFRYVFALDDLGLHVVDITFPDRPRPAAQVPLLGARNLTVARTTAYVAAGTRGLAMVDIEKPEQPGEPWFFNAHGAINDAQDVALGMSYTSSFAYVADGRNGLRVIQMTSPQSVPEWLGFSPKPRPRLIATYRTEGPAVAISRGLERDRAIDETGNQVSVFGRLGSRPLNLEEQRRMYLRDGKVWTVTDAPPTEPKPFKP
jgi:hypothetical protein